VRLLYAAGLKCVPASRVCIEVDTYEAVTTIARAAMACHETSRRLLWEDEVE
jgi:hypothetical protein